MIFSVDGTPPSHPKKGLKTTFLEGKEKTNAVGVSDVLPALSLEKTLRPWVKVPFIRGRGVSLLV